MTVGEKIREAREAKHWSKQQLADEIGVGRLHILKIEKGMELPSMACLMVVAKKLNMFNIQKALDLILK